MRTRAPILVAAAALALVGCGDRNLVLKVDVLSYMDPAYTAASFGPVPPVPGGFATGEVPLVDGVTINLLDGLSSVAEVRSVTLFLSAVVHDSTGTGLDTLRVYVSQEEIEPIWTPPIIEQAVSLQPGETDSIEVTLPADERVAGLFMGRKLRLTVTNSVRGPESGDPLNGRLVVRALDAIVIAGRKAF